MDFVNSDPQLLSDLNIWAKNNPDKTALDDPVLYKKLHDNLSHEQDSECPFCGSLKCSHWTGLGWVNPKFNKSGK